MELGLETVSSLAQALGALIPVVVVIFFGWAIYRTGSLHVLLAKAWSLVSGSKGVSDPVVAEFLDRQHSLATFRFHSGVKSPSLEHVRGLLDWTSTNGIKVAEVAGCGEFFDHDNFSVKMDQVPTLRRHRIRGLFNLAMLGVITGTALWAFNMHSAYVRFKDDGQGFVLRQYEARAYWHDIPVTAKSCGSGQAVIDIDRTGFSRKQTDQLCTFFKDPGSKAFLNDTIGSQQRALSYLAIALSLIFLGSMSQLARTANARAMNRRILALPTKPSDELD